MDNYTPEQAEAFAAGLFAAAMVCQDAELGKTSRMSEKIMSLRAKYLLQREQIKRIARKDRRQIACSDVYDRRYP